MPPEAGQMLSRPLVYTAITRARRHLSVVHAAGPALARAVRQVGARPRRTLLQALLCREVAAAGEDEDDDAGGPPGIADQQSTGPRCPDMPCRRPEASAVTAPALAAGTASSRRMRIRVSPGVPVLHRRSTEGTLVGPPEAPVHQMR